MLMLCCGLLMTSMPALAQTPGAAGTAAANEILTTQVMLDRAGFSTGEIDGRAGLNVRRALLAFQRSHKLSPSGTLDATTKERLAEHAGGEATLVAYALTTADVAGPFTGDIPDDLVEQSKLPALGYRSPLEALAERYHASPALLRSLNPGATFDRAGEKLMVPNIMADAPTAVAPAATVTAAPAVVITVTKATSSLTVTNSDGAILFHAPVTTGSQHDPLPIGRWKVTGVQKNPPFQYNPDLFWDADPTHTKATLAPGPNNPVGTVWIDITKEHYGLHGTPEPSRIGHVQSHGCVRLTNWDAERVARWARPGTPVVFTSR